MDNLFYIFVALSVLLMIIFKELICSKLQLIDYPEKFRKLHKKPTLLINGFIILISLNFFFIFQIFDPEIVEVKKNIILLILINSFYFIGYLDDIKNLSPSLKTFLIILILLVTLPLENDFILTSLEFENFISKKIILNQASIFLTIFFIYIFFNFLNFSDGINGIALSLCLFFIVTIIIKKEFLSPFEIYLLSILFICLILNIFNISFLGNSGVFLLSIIFAISFINEYNMSRLYLCDELFTIFLLPGIDMTRLVIERLLNKKKVYDGDRNHYHHLLLNFANEKYAFIIYMIIAILPYLFSFLIDSYKILISISIFFYLITLFFLKRASKKIKF